MRIFFLLALYFILHIGAFYYSADLNQVNSDQLFINQSEFDRFKEFKELTNEGNILISKIVFSQLSDKIYQEINQLVHSFDSVENGIKILTFSKLYEKKLKGQGLENHLQFIKDNPKIQFKLLGQDSILFLTIYNKEVSHSQQNQHIALLKDRIEKNTHVKKVYMAGVPYVNHLLNQFSQSIKHELFPLMFISCFILVLLVTRHLMGTLLIYLPSLMSCGLTLAFIKLFFEDMNMISSIVPLLIFILNITLGFHLYCTLTTSQSFREILDKKLSPIILMIGTTSIGFGSLYFSEIPAIRQFALLSFILIAVTGLNHMFFASITYPYFYKKFKTKKLMLSSFVHKITSIKLSPTTLLIISILFALIGFSQFSKITVNTEATKYFPKSSGYSDNMLEIYKDFFGNPSFEILLKRKDREEINFKELAKLEAFESELLKKLPHYQHLSLTQFIKEANYLYSGNFSLPESHLSYGALTMGIKPDFMTSYYPEGQYRITLLGDIVSTNEYKNQIHIINQFFKKTPYEVKLNGLYYTLRKGQAELINVLGKSFTISLLIIAFISLIHFKSAKVFSSFLIVNILPVFISFLFIRLFNLSFNIATVMTFSISLGMIVDGSFHIAHALNKDIDIVEDTYLPIFLSSVLLIFSFLSFAFYGFLPIREFGICLSINLFLGLFFDLFVLPALLKAKTT
jgi:uncharacterized protein